MFFIQIDILKQVQTESFQKKTLDVYPLNQKFDVSFWTFVRRSIIQSLTVGSGSKNADAQIRTEHTEFELRDQKDPPSLRFRAFVNIFECYIFLTVKSQ